MPKRDLPDRAIVNEADLRLQVHEALLAQRLAQVAQDSGREASRRSSSAPRQHMINLRIMRGESP